MHPTRTITRTEEAERRCTAAGAALAELFGVEAATAETPRRDAQVMRMERTEALADTLEATLAAAQAAARKAQKAAQAQADEKPAQKGKGAK